MDHIIWPYHCVVCNKPNGRGFRFTCGSGCWSLDLNEIISTFRDASDMSADDVRRMVNGMTFNDALMLMKLQAKMK